MGVFDNIKSFKKKVCTDTPGYIRALLSEFEDDLDYDHWANLICLLKYELDDDEEQAFDIFDEFSSQFDSYSKEETEKKFFDANLEGTGEVTLGSLVHWVKEVLGDNFDQAKYAQYFGTELASKVKTFEEKKERARNTLPTHRALNNPEPMDLPDPINPAEMAEILPRGLYVTGTSPYDFRLADPWSEDTLEQYISVNPMKPGSTTRNQDSCESFGFAVIEFDEMSLEEQLGYLNCFNLPIEALVFTGNKSIHAWLRVDAADLEQYRERTRLVQKMFQDIGVKPDTKVLVDPSSWVRCPGVDRVDWKGTGEVVSTQPLLYTNKTTGWNEWYRTVYPNTHDEVTIEEEPIEELPESKDQNFKRFRNKITELFGEELTTDFTECIKDSQDIEGDLKDYMFEFYKQTRNKTKMKIVESSIYFFFRDPLLEAGLVYEDSLDQLLWESILASIDYDKEQQKKYVERLEGELEVAKGYFKVCDPKLVEAIDKKITSSQSDPDLYESVCSSVVNLSQSIGFRLAVLTDEEIYKYTDALGQLLKEESLYPDHPDPLYYVYYDALHRYYEGDGLVEITNMTFPSEINPLCSFVKEHEKGFKTVQLQDNTSLKILSSRSFRGHFSEVEMISSVPVFYENEGNPILIDGYNKETGVLVTDECSEYGFLDLEEAKQIILDLFKDFQFVEDSDLSRAVACLIMPAMCHAGLLMDDFRPLVYIASDREGAGKGTLIQFLVYPYDNSPPMITQSESSAANIDEKIGHAIHKGKNHIVLDNLKPTRQMQEFSSPFLEGLITSKETPFREAHGRSTTLNTKHVTTYITTNGIKLSKDLADRSLFVSIRHRGNGFEFREFEGGIESYLEESRPKVMSAIYTVIKEYVSRGKGQKRPKEPHRFLTTVPILNKLVTDIFGLPDITLQNSKRAKGTADDKESTLRSICFAVNESKRLGESLSSIDIFEVLDEYGNRDVLNVRISDNELYSDESMNNFTRDAKQQIGISISRLLSSIKKGGELDIDEFFISKLTSGSVAKYVFRKR